MLAGLEELSRKDPQLRGCGIRFAPNVRLLSGVSGGSLAILNFVDAYQPKRAELAGSPRAVVDMSDRSSLDPLVWGLVYPDLRRALLPFLLPPARNRGGELENEWRLGLGQSGVKSDLGLATWRSRTASGGIPALIFNSTNAETGERILTGTTRMELGLQAGRVMFDQLYESKWDLAPVTAVRMSATFPYVTPAAKPSYRPTWRGDTSWVDGGYSDNFGMASILDWVQEALSAPNSRLRRVMIIQIRAAPDALAQAKTAEGGRGIFYQLGVPLETMLSVWNSGQAVRNDTQLAMIQFSWGYLEGEKGYDIETVWATLRIPPDPDKPAATLPLSWHLTEKQKAELDDAWEKLVQGPRSPWPAVKAFLLGEKAK